MGQYRFEGKSHLHLQDVKVKELKRGDIVETDKPLDKMFPNVWVPVGAAPVTNAVLDAQAANTQQPTGAVINLGPDEPGKEPNANLTDAEKPPLEARGPEAGKSDEKQDFGEDLTDHFEAAESADLRVFKKGKKYFVLDADGKSPLNEDDLTSKAKVEDFLDEYKATK